MDAIWQKIRADITSRVLISALIVVTIAAAAALLTLALATLFNLGAPYDRAFAELNGAHLWLYFDRERIREHDIQRIEALPDVMASTGVQYSVNRRIETTETGIWTSIRAMPSAMPPVNALQIESGRYLEADRFEVLGSTDLYDIYHLAAGDTIEIPRWDDKKVRMPVIGVAYNPMWDIYRNTQPPYLYVTMETMRELFPDKAAWDWSLGLRLADPEAVEKVYAQIEGMLRRDAVVSYTDWRNVKRSAVFEAKLNLVFLGAFSFFAIVAAMLVITSSISSTVLAQFRQIGLLKAVGFTQNQVLSLYIGQYLVLALIAVPLGLGLGIALSPIPLKSVATSLSAPFRPPVNPILIALVVAAVLAVAVLATLGSASRGARANTIKAIAVGAEPPHKRPSWVVQVVTSLGLPMVFVLGLNDVFARPFRSFLTGLNLTLGVIGIVFGLTLNDTLETYRKDPSLMGIVYDATVTREQTSHSQTERILRQAPGVVAFYGEHLVEVQTEQGQPFKVRAVEGDAAAFPFRLSEGRFFQPGTDEAIAGQGLLSWLGLQVGDELTVTIEGQEKRPVTWKIVGQYNEPANVGQMLTVNLSTLARVLKGIEPYTYRLKLGADADVVVLRRYLEPQKDSDLSLLLIGQTIPSAVTYLQLAMFGLSGVLIGIALVNVFNTSLLTVQEKLRAIGVLKTVGMTPAQVVAMVNTTAGFLGLVAAGLGLPLGLVFTQALLAVLSNMYGFGQVQVSLNWLYVLFLPPLIVGISMLGSVFPGRRAARLSIVRVLRHE